MGILDEAIKEHLELKRQHGAGESELKQLEDEAFGAAERPGDEAAASDALAEAPTAFMAPPDLAETEAEEASSGRRPMSQLADLQEGPEQDETSDEAEVVAEAGPPLEADLPAEEPTAMEHEAVGEPEPAAEPDVSASHTTEERHAIAEHPTEMYDVEEELAAQEREVEVTDAREESDDIDDEFWDEKRLSDELDQALEAPIEPEVSAGAETEVESEPAEPAEPAAEEEPDSEDVLEETPDFLEEAPEDDQLWFEQKPPKDFDFDD